MTNQTTKQQSAQDAYTAAHATAMELIAQIQHAVEDMDAPSDAIHWGHVGDANEINSRMARVLCFLSGTEE